MEQVKSDRVSSFHVQNQVQVSVAGQVRSGQVRSGHRSGQVIGQVRSGRRRTLTGRCRAGDIDGARGGPETEAGLAFDATAARKRSRKLRRRRRRRRRSRWVVPRSGGGEQPVRLARLAQETENPVTGAAQFRGRNSREKREAGAPESSSSDLYPITAQACGGSDRRGHAQKLNRRCYAMSYEPANASIFTNKRMRKRFWQQS